MFSRESVMLVGGESTISLLDPLAEKNYRMRVPILSVSVVLIFIKVQFFSLLQPHIAIQGFTYPMENRQQQRGVAGGLLRD
jgi:hypothetical protein